MSSLRANVPVFFSLLIVCVFGTAAFAGAEAVLSFSAAPGAASETRVLSVPKSGCYAFRAEGSGGASLTAIDRMYGRIGTASASGDPSSPTGRSARFTAFLESGEYKLILSKRAENAADASVERFADIEAEASQAEFGRFRDLKLADGETVSFSVKVGTDRRLRFLALGRSLGGMRLFRSGGWAADIEPYSGSIEIDPGKPMRYTEFAHDADPGEYRVVCWGDSALPWSSEGTSQGGAPRSGAKNDFFVMEGERRFDEIGLYDLTLGSSGLECLSIPGNVGFAQATVSGDAKIALSWAGGRGSRLSSSASAVTDPRGGYKAATLRISTGQDWKWLVVRGKAGQRYSLRFFPVAEGNNLAVESFNKTDVEVAVRAIGSVEGEDSVPFTARTYVLNSVDGRVYSLASIAERALTLSSSAVVRLNANLLQRNSFLLDVGESGKYVVLEKDTKKASALWSFFPLEGFSLNRRDARTVKSGDSFELSAGKYLLVMEVKVPGALDAVIAKDGMEAKLGGMGLWKKSMEPSGNALSWYGLKLPETNMYRKTAFAFGERAGVVQGFSVRNYPVSLSEKPFSARIEEGATVRVACTLDRPSFLRSNGGAVRALINGMALNEGEPYPAGRYELRLNAADGKETWANVEAVPVSDAPPPERYDSCREGAPSWTEFDRGETKRFLLAVDSPALYTLSTTGRLETNIRLRGKMRPSLAQSSGGGPGRNARVSAYLKAGDYLVEVGVAGASKGAAGIALERRPVRVLPPLREDGRVRATAEAGEALAVPVEISSGGRWAVSSAGLARSFSYRFEDSMGWPVGSPTGSASYSGSLEPGKYRFISLDEAVPTRRVFTLDKMDEAARVDPYSPAAAAAAKNFRAALGRTYERSWRGTGPDEAVLELAAPVSVTLALSAEMWYRTTLPDGRTGEAGLGAKKITLDLPAGKTVVSVKPLIEDQDHSYTIRFDCPDLMENRPLSVQAGSAIFVSTGRKGNWELETSGGKELEAALFARSGNSYRLVATSRAIPDDWNCLVSAPLDAGRYIVKFAAPGDPRLSEAPNPLRIGASSSGDSLARLRFRADAAVRKASGAFSLSAELSSDFLAVDFTADRTGPYRFAVDSGDPAELFVEKNGERLAYGKTEVYVSLSGGGEYRVRCGRAGEGTAKVGLSCEPLAFSEASIRSDDTLESGDRAVRLRDASRMSRVVDAPLLMAAVGNEKQFLPSSREPFRADGAWLLRADGGALSRVALPRVSSGASGALSLPLYGEGQKIAVTVPEGSVALVRAASRGFETSLTESALVDSSSAVNWGALSVSAERTVLGLAAGERAVVVRDSRPSPDGRLVPVSSETVPVVRAERIAVGKTRTFTVGASSAVAVTSEGSPREVRGRVSALVSLERGLAAFESGEPKVNGADRTVKTAAAFDESETFTFADLSGTLYVVNTGNAPAIASVEVTPLGAPSPVVSERESWEAVFDGPRGVTLRIDGRGAGTELSAAGDIALFRFFDEETGEASSGTTVDTAAGPMIVAKGRRGILRLEAFRGYIKVFLSKGSDRVDSFVDLAGFSASASGRAVGAGQTVSGAGGAAFAVNSAQSGSLLSASASGPGVLALIGPGGRILAADAGLESQEAIAAADSGAYSVFVRPFKGLSRTGIVSADAAPVETVDKSGALSPRLASEGRLHAYRFAAAGGLVGMGVRAERDGLRVRLYDSALILIDEGPLLIRRLDAGVYYLVVTSERGTARYQPVWFGLEGSRADVPEEVVARYLKNGEE